MSSPLISLESFRNFSDYSTTEYGVGPPGNTQVHQLPVVKLNTETMHPFTLPKNATDLAFINQGYTGLWKKILVTWRTQGFQKTMDILAQNQSDNELVRKLLNGVFSIWKIVRTFHNQTVKSEGHVLSNKDTVAILSRTRDWQTSSVKSLAWHPHCTKLALATFEDYVLVYNGSSSTPVIARHPSQKDITCLEWRPCSAAHLAVGCALGVALWTIDPSSLGTRPSASCLIHLPHNSPVHSLSWHPQGTYLASGCAKSTSVFIWNVENRELVPLKKIAAGGYQLLLWSPIGDRLLTATSTSTFRIWETRTWTAENWSVMDGRVQSAAWSPCGTKLIFTDSVAPTLYCLTLKPVPPLGETWAASFENGTSKTATVVADFTETEHLTDNLRIGGLVQDIAWDPRGERLAVLFRSTDVIIVFRTRYTPTFTLLPCGLIQGQNGEHPSTMLFKKDFHDGALLTVSWSSGRVEHVPFIFIYILSC